MSGPTTRVVSLQADSDSAVGAWQLLCDQCPLKAHLRALGMKARPCAAGIQTKLQGYVPLKTCDHYVKDSLQSTDKQLSLLCAANAEGGAA